MKFIYTPKDPKNSYSKYKSDLGEYYDALIEACEQWEQLCSKNMFDSSKLRDLLQSDVLKQMEQIDKNLKDTIDSSGIKSFLIEMINGQHTDLLIPYLKIEKSLPEEFYNIHIGLLGSGEEIFDVINES